MTIESLLAILAAGATLIGGFFSLPWLVQRKLRAIVDERVEATVAALVADVIGRQLNSYYTKLDAVTMFVSKAENDARFKEVRDEMARNHRLLVAVAMKLDVSPALLDG